jgi:hypothetical protein
MSKKLNGKLFSKDYQPPEKWTEGRALKLGDELILWLKSKDENIFFEEFLYIDNDYYASLICYLTEKFSSFSDLIVKAKKIQELKLQKFGVLDKLNAPMTKFVLINQHDWKDKKEIDQKTEINSKPQIIVDTPEQKKDLEDFINNL